MPMQYAERIDYIDEMMRDPGHQFHIDSSQLEGELVAALEKDRVDKATEAMKKRAIRSAKSYDEFKVSLCGGMLSDCRALIRCYSTMD